jgi:hypothetical protein
MTYERPTLPRTVKPRPPVTVSLTPIIVVTATIIFVERADRYYDISDLFSVLRCEPPSLVVCEGASRLLHRLDRHFRGDPRWQFCVTPLERERWTSNQTPTLVRTHDTLVSFFGWKGQPLPDGPRGGKRKSRNHYHITLDPVSFSGKGALELLGRSDGADSDALYDWSVQVRQFCLDNRLSLKPTAGGLAGQLLRDHRFYPKPRRKVPAVTNAKARDHLPGNHYRLYTDGDNLEAFYLDQSAAHHRCALTLDFPCANRLYAWGNYRTDSTSGRIPTRIQAKLLTYHGLFRLRVNIPESPHGMFPPPWAEYGGERDIWVYSNELPILRELRIHIACILEAHVSPHLDTGINAYAQWALGQITPKPVSPWIKPILLSTYGILAAKPRIHRVGYAQAIGGTPKLYPAGAGHLSVMERATQFATEPGYANVIHRGMIEAETRLRSLQLARDLHRRGYSIIACYADSIFVATRDANGHNVALPLLPPGWQVESELTHLQFFNPVSFTSDQMTKTPGIPSRRMSMGLSARNPRARKLTR